MLEKRLGMFEEKSPLAKKSAVFAVQLVTLCRSLREETKEYSLIDQLMRSGTSIGANVRESLYAQSRADFLTKLTIALKEASETEYWLYVMHEAGLLDDQRFILINDSNRELIRMLTTSVNTVKSHS